jgi:hypothetical protein
MTVSTRPEEKLLSAVIGLAIDDVCLEPTKGHDKKTGKKILVMRHDAVSAYQFLFFHGDGYMVALDIDPSQFKKRLLSQLLDRSNNLPFDVSNRSSEIINRRKRMFRINHHLYQTVYGQGYKS